MGFRIPPAAMILIAAFLTVTSTPVFGETGEGGKYSIGFGAGLTGGFGLSFKYWIDEKSALQINFLPLYFEEKYPEDGDYYFDPRISGYSNEGMISLGALYKHELGSAQSMGLSVFTYGGGNWLGIFNNKDYRTETRIVKSNETRHISSAGGGFGGTLTIWRIELSGMLGFFGSYDAFSGTKSLLPSIDAAAHFRL